MLFPHSRTREWSVECQDAARRGRRRIFTTAITPMDGVFPILTHDDVLAFQFSFWYPRFNKISIKSTVIRPLGDMFRRYMLSNGVHLPDSLENVCLIARITAYDKPLSLIPQGCVANQ